MHFYAYFRLFVTGLDNDEYDKRVQFSRFLLHTEVDDTCFYKVVCEGMSLHLVEKEC